MENEIMNSMEKVMENNEALGTPSGNNGIGMLDAFFVSVGTYVGLYLSGMAIKSGRKFLKARKEAKELVIDNTAHASDDVEG